MLQPFCIFETVEKPAGIRAGKRVQPVRLAFFDAIMRDSTLRTQELRLTLHFRVPAMLFIFAHIHEDAHLGDRLEFGRRRLPHVSWKCRDREEIFRTGGRDVKRRDATVGWAGNVKLPVLNLVVREDHLQEFWKIHSPLSKNSTPLGAAGATTIYPRFSASARKLRVSVPLTVSIVCGPPPNMMTPG